MSDELADRSFLVADDESFSRDMLRSMLNQLRPKRVDTVTNGAEALDALRADGAYYDCVITDFKMEPVNGLELLKAIRVGTSKIRRGFPVILVTGHSGTDLIGSALALDANGFLAKPIAAVTLWSRLKRVLGEPTPLRAAVAYSVIATRSGPRATDALPLPEAEPPRAVPQLPPHALMLQPTRPVVLQPARTPTPQPRTAAPQASGAAPAPVPGAAPQAPGSVAPQPKSTAGAAPDAPPQRSMRMISCTLHEVPAGAVLARDLMTKSGTTLITANNQLSARLLNRLRDLVDIETVVNQVWIYEQEPQP